MKMTTDSTLIKFNEIYNNLKLVKELVYNKCGFELSSYKQNLESEDYEACSFTLNGKSIHYRNSKITPKKIGQFATIWKRNKLGITEPFDFLDPFDFLIITSKEDNNFGQFIFPKSVLVDNAVISINGTGGKRGIRVYPPWNIVVNKQAIKTQNWQTEYFLTIKSDNSNLLDSAKKMML